MTRREKALLEFLAKNLDERAKNARAHADGGNGPADDLLESKGAAYAFQVAADYLRGAKDGHEKLPSMATLGAMAALSAE